MTTREEMAFRTSAYVNALKGMEVPRGMMTFSKGGKGKPSKDETTLFLGAVSFAYAVWENYVEELAIELTRSLAAEIAPEQIPTASRAVIEKDASSWELSVHPGWRGLWINRVTAITKGGEDGRGGWGLNSATFDNTKEVFETSGFGGALPTRLTVKARDATAPQNVRDTKGEVDVKNALTQLIEVRGGAVHTATAPDHLRKGHVRWWLAFVEALFEETDRQALQEVDRLLDRGDRHVGPSQ
jgi:hypothetical protein